MPDPIEFVIAHEAERIGEDLIARHHDFLLADGVTFLWLFTTQERKEGRKIVGASIHKLTPLQRFLSSGKETVEGGEHYLVLINREVWAALSGVQRRALVDHELCHLAWDDEKERVIWRAHDIEEYADVLERHGLWKSDVREFADVAQQQLALL